MIFAKVEYGFQAPLTLLQLTTPYRMLRYRDQGHGGYDESADGIPEMIRIRQDYARALQISFKDSEYIAVIDWIEFAQSAGSVPWSFWFDGTDDLTKYSMFLQSPKVGQEFNPEPDSYLGLWWLPIEIRTSDGSRITYNHSGV